MRIAMFVSQFPDLPETFVLDQITGLIDRGNEVDIYSQKPSHCPCDHPEVEQYGLRQRCRYLPELPPHLYQRAARAVRLVLRGVWSPNVVLRAVNVCKYGRQAVSLRNLYRIPPLVRKEYDIIHCHYGTCGLWALGLRELGAIRGPLVTAFHGFDISRFVHLHGNNVYSPLLNKGQLFLPVSDCWARRLEQLGCDTRKLHVHRMGVSCKRIAFERRWCEPGEPVRIMSVARLVEKKGLVYGIEAFARARRIRPGMLYDIVGDGPRRAHLQRMIDCMALGDSVRLVGWKTRPQVRQLMQGAHIMLCPSQTAADGDQEGIPVSLMEAMATGLPVIASRISGIPELVTDGVEGFLVPQRDVDALADRLGYLLSNRQACCEMGRAGRSKVQREFNVDLWNNRLVERFKSLKNHQEKSKYTCVCSPLSESRGLTDASMEVQ